MPDSLPKFFFCLLVLLSSASVLLAQQRDSSAVQREFSGHLTATNNGISIIPSFSLDKPALVAIFKLRGKRWSFEPDLRFALEGKPWSMLFWARYQAVSTKRFSLRLGAHPAVNFRTITIIDGGEKRELIETRRYLASEIVPQWRFTNHFSVGGYYLASRGFDDGLRSAHFVQLNAAIGNVPIGPQLRFHLFPQVYFLRLDQLEGTYASASWRISKPGSPFALSGILNRSIKTEISPERVFLWNVAVEYGFGGQYRRMVPEV